MAEKEAWDDEEAIKAFGRRLRESLRVRGVSGAELARRVDVSSNTVSGWTRGTSAPGHKHLIRIIQALNAGPAELLGDQSPTSSKTSSDQLVLQLAGLRLTSRVHDLATVGSSVLATLEQIDRRAAEISGGDSGATGT
jgi:transcriptional regulator with XRE-family HTH domain